METSISKKPGSVRSSTSRPSSIPRLIPLTDSQKKGYLLRNILARNVREGRITAENYPPSEESSQGSGAKRVRLTVGHSQSFSSSSGIPSSISTTSIASVGTDCGVLDIPGPTIRQQKTPTTLKKYEADTADLRTQISVFFGTAPECAGIPRQLKPVSPSCDYFDPMQKTIDDYAQEILIEELKNEAVNYQLTCTKELERQLSKRKDAVIWVRKMGLGLKLLYQTIHVAAYIVDAFLRTQAVPLFSLELLSAAAIFIAAKQEETDFTISAERILRECSQAGRYTAKRLVTMEAKILNKLKFRICCPTSQFFMSACASQMTYPDRLTKQFTIELAECLLFYALGENELMFCSNARKARLALYYAVKYVCFNYKLLQTVYPKDKGIWDKFRIKCFPDFKAAVLHGIQLPKSLNVFNGSPKVVLKDTTNKACRRTLSKSCATIPTARSMCVK